MKKKKKLTAKEATTLYLLQKDLGKDLDEKGTIIDKFKVECISGNKTNNNRLVTTHSLLLQNFAELLLLLSGDEKNAVIEKERILALEEILVQLMNKGILFFHLNLLDIKSNYFSLENYLRKLTGSCLLQRKEIPLYLKDYMREMKEFGVDKNSFINVKETLARVNIRDIDVLTEYVNEFPDLIHKELFS